MAKRRRVEGEEQQQGSKQPEQQPAVDSEDGDDQLAFNQLSGKLFTRVVTSSYIPALHTHPAVAR